MGGEENGGGEGEEFNSNPDTRPLSNGLGFWVLTPKPRKPHKPLTRTPLNFKSYCEKIPKPLNPKPLNPSTPQPLNP